MSANAEILNRRMVLIMVRAAGATRGAEYAGRLKDTAVMDVGAAVGAR